MQPAAKNFATTGRSRKGEPWVWLTAAGLTFGVLMALAGLSYLSNSLALLLAPALASALFPAVLVPAFVGELSFALWLTFKGVNVQQWAR